jgi:hypothetical protein
MSRLIECVGRRRLDVSVVDEKIQIRITIGDVALAHLMLPVTEAVSLRTEIDRVLDELLMRHGHD